jgi:hypothetical protein
MSNRLFLESTEFKNPVTGESTYGYRLYDDHDSTYHNLMDECLTDDLQLLKYAIVNDESGMLDFIEEMEKGIYINDTYYQWDQIKDSFAEVSNKNA